MKTYSNILNSVDFEPEEYERSPKESSYTENVLCPTKKFKYVNMEPPSGNIEDDEVFSDLDPNNEIILSVCWKRGKLGAAYFTNTTSELYLLNDVVDIHPDFNNLKNLLSQVEPSQLVTSGGLCEDFINCLLDIFKINRQEHEEIQLKRQQKSSLKHIFFMSSKKKDLSYESCKRYILGLRLGFEPEFLNEQDHVLFISSHIDLAQESMVISLGMLVKYLEKYLPQVNLDHEFFKITFLNHISLDSLVSMDDNTYQALQIFNTRVHPSAFKRNVSGSNREGLSLFGIFNRCRSTAGSKRLKEIFMSPRKNLMELNERLDAVEFCSKPQHQHIVKNMVDCIKRVESVTGILASIYRARSNISLWRSLYSSLYNAILVGEICQRHSSHSTFLEKIAKSITQNIHEVTHYINQVVDFEESSVNSRFTVRSGIDKKLDLLRQTYSQMPDVLVKVAEIELEDLPTFIEQCSIIYITELGYLLSVPIWKGNGTDPGDYTLPNFEVKFIVNNFVHYKTPRCTELDNVLGDSVALISDAESKIMISLIQFVHTRIADVVQTFRLIAELDWLDIQLYYLVSNSDTEEKKRYKLLKHAFSVISLAMVASENNYSRPFLTEERELEIIQGRHPLQELCVDNFVPNDIKFGSDSCFIKILTGPNASGKSVYLKQAALIAYLAHIGSFVPAQSAKICILDHIHSRLQSVESISTRMSAFLIDLKQMSLSLYNSTPRSLLIIDEFGKGTTEIDGLSLLAGSLNHFIGRKENCPYILVSTHFYRLPRFLPSTPLLHFQCMDYFLENEEIIYLHKVKDGTSNSSLTHLAAKTAGVAEAVERSLQILDGRLLVEPNYILKTTKAMMK